MSLTDSWCSPPEVCDGLLELFGGPVDVDPCSNPTSIVQARQALTSGGLILPWRLSRPVGWSVYENDPYSCSGAWTTKTLAEVACGNVRELVRLCMFQPSVDWWRRMCRAPRRNPRVLALRRLKFLDPSTGAPAPSVCRFEPALFYIGPRVAKFDKAFKHVTSWSTWGRTDR